MAGFFVLLIVLGWLISQAVGSPTVLYIAVVIAILMNLISYWFSDKVVIALTRAKPADEREWRELHNIVENLAITAGLPKPAVYVLNEAQPNAFATGRNPKHAVIAVTTGLLERLDRSELEGVLAHELSHIGNSDMLVSTVAVVLAGVIAIVSDLFLRFGFFGRDRDSRAGAILMIVAIAAAILAPFAALLMQLAISRKREYLADASGALLTRYPEGLARALEKIASDPNPLRVASNATNHLFFASPLRGRQKVGAFARLFLTHPPVEERVKALRGTGASA